jgi:hypothetical protein
MDIFNRNKKNYILKKKLFLKKKKKWINKNK